MAHAANEAINRIISKQQPIKISEVALGEYFRILVDKEFKEDPEALLSHALFKIKQRTTISICVLPIEKLSRFISLIGHIKSKNQRIDFTDVIILACSLADEECRCLLTFDQELIQNKDINDVVKKETKDRKGFLITDRSPI